MSNRRARAAHTPAITRPLRGRASSVDRAMDRAYSRARCRAAIGPGRVAPARRVCLAEQVVNRSPHDLLPRVGPGDALQAEAHVERVGGRDGCALLDPEAAAAAPVVAVGSLDPLR